MAKKSTKKRLKNNIVASNANTWLTQEPPTPPDLTLVNSHFNSEYSAELLNRGENHKVKFANPLTYVKYFALSNPNCQLTETGRTHDDDRTPMLNAVVLNLHYSFALINYIRQYRTQADLKALLLNKGIVVTTLSARKDVINGTASVMYPQRINKSLEPQKSTLSRLSEPDWKVTVHYTYNNWVTEAEVEARLIKHMVRTNISRYEFCLKLDSRSVHFELGKEFFFYAIATDTVGQSFFRDDNDGKYYIALICVDE